MKASSLNVVLHFLRRHETGAGSTTLTDRQLLAQFVEQQDQQAFSLLVCRHAPLVFRVCWRALRNWQDAEDAFQATFLVLARKANSPGWHESIAGWLHEVACRVAAEARGTLSRRHTREKQVDPMPERSAPHEPDPAELTSVVDEELRHLPEAYRTPVVLCCLQGLSRDAAAEQLGCSVGVVKGRLERGRRLLAERLQRRGVAVASTVMVLLPCANTELRPAPQLVQQTLDLSAQFVHGALRGTPPVAVQLANGVLHKLLRGWMATTAVTVALLFTLTSAAVGFVVTKAPHFSSHDPKSVAVEVPSSPQSLPAPQQLVTYRHEGPVRGVVVTPDGKTAISASFDGTIQVWEANTGKRLHTWTIKSLNSALALSPDGKTLAVGNSDGELFLFDLKTFEERTARLTRQGNVYHLAFSPDGKLLASANHQGTVSLWNAATGAPLKTLAGHERRVWNVAFSPDSKQLASAGEDGTIRVWDPTTGKELHSTKVHTDYTAAVTFSPDGKRLVSLGYDDRLFIIEASSGKKLKEVEVPSGSCILFLPDGKTLLTTDRTGNFHLWHPDTLERLHTGSKHDKAVFHAAFSADGRRILTASEDGTAIVWSLDPARKAK